MKTWFDLVHFLQARGACGDARKWVLDQKRSPRKTLAELWNECERGDWLLWLSVRAGVDRKLVVMAACACARLSLQYVKKGENRPRLAIEVAEAWSRGEVEIGVVRAAADAAYAAAAADAAYAAADAAYAADAADAAYAAAYAAAAYAAAAADAAAAYAAAAADAAYAADAADAAYAADAADAAYARKRMQWRTALAVRNIIKIEDVLNAAKEK